MEMLFKGGVTVRNQTVLIRNVNDSVATMTEHEAIKAAGLTGMPIAVA